MKLFLPLTFVLACKLFVVQASFSESLCQKRHIFVFERNSANLAFSTEYAETLVFDYISAVSGSPDVMDGVRIAMFQYGKNAVIMKDAGFSTNQGVNSFSFFNTTLMNVKADSSGLIDPVYIFPKILQEVGFLTGSDLLVSIIFFADGKSTPEVYDSNYALNTFRESIENHTSVKETFIGCMALQSSLSPVTVYPHSTPEYALCDYHVALGPGSQAIRSNGDTISYQQSALEYANSATCGLLNLPTMSPTKAPTALTLSEPQTCDKLLFLVFHRSSTSLDRQKEYAKKVIDRIEGGEQTLGVLVAVHEHSVNSRWRIKFSTFGVESTGNTTAIKAAIDAVEQRDLPSDENYNRALDKVVEEVQLMSGSDKTVNVILLGEGVSTPEPYNGLHAAATFRSRIMALSPVVNKLYVGCLAVQNTISPVTVFMYSNSTYPLCDYQATIIPNGDVVSNGQTISDEASIVEYVSDAHCQTPSPTTAPTNEPTTSPTLSPTTSQPTNTPTSYPTTLSPTNTPTTTPTENTKFSEEFCDKIMIFSFQRASNMLSAQVNYAKQVLNQISVTGDGDTLVGVKVGIIAHSNRIRFYVPFANNDVVSTNKTALLDVLDTVIFKDGTNFDALLIRISDETNLLTNPGGFSPLFVTMMSFEGGVETPDAYDSSAYANGFRDAVTSNPVIGDMFIACIAFQNTLSPVKVHPFSDSQYGFCDDYQSSVVTSNGTDIDSVISNSVSITLSQSIKEIAMGSVCPARYPTTTPTSTPSATPTIAPSGTPTSNPTAHAGYSQLEGSFSFVENVGSWTKKTSNTLRYDFKQDCSIPSTYGRQTGLAVFKWNQNQGDGVLIDFTISGQSEASQYDTLKISLDGEVVETIRSDIVGTYAESCASGSINAFSSHTIHVNTTTPGNHVLEFFVDTVDGRSNSGFFEVRTFLEIVSVSPVNQPTPSPTTSSPTAPEFFPGFDSLVGSVTTSENVGGWTQVGNTFQYDYIEDCAESETGSVLTQTGDITFDWYQPGDTSVVINVTITGNIEHNFDEASASFDGEVFFSGVKGDKNRDQEIDTCGTKTIYKLQPVSFFQFVNTAGDHRLKLKVDSRDGLYNKGFWKITIDVKATVGNHPTTSPTLSPSTAPSIQIPVTTSSGFFPGFGSLVPGKVIESQEDGTSGSWSVSGNMFIFNFDTDCDLAESVVSQNNLGLQRGAQTIYWNQPAGLNIKFYFEVEGVGEHQWEKAYIKLDGGTVFSASANKNKDSFLRTCGNAPLYQTTPVIGTAETTNAGSHRLDIFVDSRDGLYNDGFWKITLTVVVDGTISPSSSPSIAPSLSPITSSPTATLLSGQFFPGFPVSCPGALSLSQETGTWTQFYNVLTYQYNEDCDPAERTSFQNGIGVQRGTALFEWTQPSGVVLEFTLTIKAYTEANWDSLVITHNGVEKSTIKGSTTDPIDSQCGAVNIYKVDRQLSFQSSFTGTNELKIKFDSQDGKFNTKEWKITVSVSEFSNVS